MIKSQKNFIYPYIKINFINYKKMSHGHGNDIDTHNLDIPEFKLHPRSTECKEHIR